MKLLLEPSKYTKEQREAIAGFILTYPSTAMEEIDNGGDEFGEDRPLSPATLRAVETLKTEDSPEAAFGLSIPQPPPATPGPLLVIPPPATGVIPTDKNGLPWDSRIHASTKVISTDGTWRKRRGVDDAVVAQVEAELKQVMSIPVRPTTSPTVSVAAAIPAPPDAPTTPVPAAPVNDSAPYFDLINRCSALMTDGKAKREEIQGICIAVGLPSLALLGTRKDLVPEISAAVEQLVAER